MMVKRRSWIDRFWSKVSKGSDDECWPWNGGKTNFGHGVFAIRTKKLVGAHVASWIIAHEVWPSDCILHKCDVPHCVNPKHLFEGSRVDNMKDKCAKGRQPKGEATNRNKLSEEQALKVFFDHRSQTAIAKDYGIHQTTVRDIKCGVTWRHVTGV